MLQKFSKSSPRGRKQIIIKTNNFFQKFQLIWKEKKIKAEEKLTTFCREK